MRASCSTERIGMTRSKTQRLAPFVLVGTVAGCAGSTPVPAVPPFEGVESPSWIAYELPVPGRDPADFLPAFEASARALGCDTSHLGERENGTISNGVLRHWYGVTAACGEDGTLSLVTMVGERVRIGFAKPSSKGACDALLVKITSAR